MYRHILVPIDDSPLVDRHRAAGRRARARARREGDVLPCAVRLGVVELGALERVMSPGAFNRMVAGEARAMLAKAEVVARTAGVAHDAFAMTSNRPHEAILGPPKRAVATSSSWRRTAGAASRASCSARRRRRCCSAPRSRCWSRAVESNARLPRRDAALAIDSRRAPLARGGDPRSRIRGSRSARSQGTPPSFPLLRAMLHYVARVSGGAASPEGRRISVPRCCARAPRVTTMTLDDAQRAARRRHRRSSTALSRQHRGLRARIPRAACPASREAAGRFATAQMEHMMFEAKVIIPAARKHLTSEDWAEIARRLRRQWRPALHVGRGRGVPPSLYPHPQPRAGRCGRHHANNSIKFQPQGTTTMHSVSASSVARRTSPTVDRAGRAVLRARRSHSRSTSAIRTSRCAGTTRCATTSAARASRRIQAIHRQPEQRRRRPQFQQRLARHQPARHAVRVRLRVASGATARA